MASTTSSKKLRVLLIPFFATSHIGPFTDLAVRLATARPDTVVEATIAVTPANVAVVESLLARHLHLHGHAERVPPVIVKVATYPFPAVDGLPEGVENPGKAAQADAWRIDVAAMSEALTRPAQEALIRAQSPDAVFTDVHFLWNAGIADELGVPCVTFSVIGAFSTLAMRHLADVNRDAEVVTVPRFPAPEIRIRRTELPEFLRSQPIMVDFSATDRLHQAQDQSFGLVVNTSSDLEQRYCEMYTRHGYVKRAYFVGPLSLLLSQSGADADAGAGDSPCIQWLDTKPSRSVAYLCFGSLTHFSETQLRELALGLEASGKPFLWVVRAEEWTPPDGWKERVGDRGMVITGWAPQTAILRHPAVAAFVTHCGWNSVLETVAAGVPVLTWPMVFEQFITERLVTEVLGIGVRLWPEDCAGVRSTRYEENEVIPAEAVARALMAFMRPGGPGDAARRKVVELAGKAHAAVAEGGSSHRDLCHLIDDLTEARGAAAGRTTASAEYFPIAPGRDMGIDRFG